MVHPFLKMKYSRTQCWPLMRWIKTNDWKSLWITVLAQMLKGGAGHDAQNPEQAHRGCWCGMCQCLERFQLIFVAGASGHDDPKMIGERNPRSGLGNIPVMGQVPIGAFCWGSDFRRLLRLTIRWEWVFDSQPTNVSMDKKNSKFFGSWLWVAAGASMIRTKESRVRGISSKLFVAMRMMNQKIRRIRGTTCEMNFMLRHGNFKSL